MKETATGFLLLQPYSLFSYQVILLIPLGNIRRLDENSLVASNLVMKAIAHNVFCVCPKCGTKGIPMCPVCHVAMYWNGYRGEFICPACGKSGFPVCPRCNHQMTLIESM